MYTSLFSHGHIHHTSAKPFRDRREAVFTASQCRKEQVVPFLVCVLTLLDGANRGVLRRTLRALDVVDSLAFCHVQAALVERVLAHEMHRGLLKSIAA